LEFHTRRALIFPLGFLSLFFGLAEVGVGNATTNASPIALYTEALVLLVIEGVLMWASTRTSRLWLSWLYLFLAAVPFLLFFGLMYA